MDLPACTLCMTINEVIKSTMYIKGGSIMIQKWQLCTHIQRFLQQTGGARGGWDEYDHNTFQHIRSKYPVSSNIRCNIQWVQTLDVNIQWVQTLDVNILWVQTLLWRTCVCTICKEVRDFYTIHVICTGSSAGEGLRGLAPPSLWSSSILCKIRPVYKCMH